MGHLCFFRSRIATRLPLQKFALVVISSIYLARALFGLLLVASNPDHVYLQELQQQPVFMIISSIICLVFGLVYVIGTRQVWTYLSIKKINILHVAPGVSQS